MVTNAAAVAAAEVAADVHVYCINILLTVPSVNKTFCQSIGDLDQFNLFCLCRRPVEPPVAKFHASSICVRRHCVDPAARRAAAGSYPSSVLVPTIIVRQS